MRHLPLRELGYALGFLTLLAALYVGTYCAMMDRIMVVMTEGDVGAPDIRRSSVTYRFGDDWARDFFAPLHELDKRLRPEYWPMD